MLLLVLDSVQWHLLTKVMPPTEIMTSLNGRTSISFFWIIIQIIFHVISRKIWCFFPSLRPLPYFILVLDSLHLRKEKGIEKKYVQIQAWKLGLCCGRIFSITFFLVETKYLKGFVTWAGEQGLEKWSKLLPHWQSKL